MLTGFSTLNLVCCVMFCSISHLLSTRTRHCTVYILTQAALSPTIMNKCSICTCPLRLNGSRKRSTTNGHISSSWWLSVGCRCLSDRCSHRVAWWTVDMGVQLQLRLCEKLLQRAVSRVATLTSRRLSESTPDLEHTFHSSNNAQGPSQAKHVARTRISALVDRSNIRVQRVR